MEPVLSPAYARDFLCIGSQCPLTCCAGWTVPVDELKKSEYDSCPDNIMREKFAEFVVPFKEGLRAYRIEFTEDGLCPFLNASSLCDMQLRLGIDWLPAACAYPKRGVLINGTPEMSMVLSCPVSAGLALFLDGDMRFEEGAGELPPHITEIEFSQPYAAFRACRDFLLEIIKTASLPFEARLFLLGVFIEREWGRDYLETADKCEAFRRYMRKSAGNTRALTADYVLQFDIISKLLEAMANRAPIAEYGALLGECGKGLNSVAESLLKRGLREDPYAAVTRSFKENGADITRVFENYFANEIFREVLACAGFRDNGFALPEPDADALKKAYMLWCVSYRMLYFQFACLYALKGELSRVDIVDCVTLFCRAAFTHDAVFSEEFCALMTEWGLSGPGALAPLIMS